MPYTRTQANALLSKAEMTLFDESRANAVRKFDAKALGSRVERARKLRDKARDQLQRQRLASRGRTGSKRGTSGDANRRSKDKAELLADILKRLEVQAKASGKRARADAGAKKAATKAGGKKTTAKKAVGKKTAAKKTAAKETVAKKAAATKTAPKKTAAKRTAAKNASPRKSAKTRTSATRETAPEKTKAGKAAPMQSATKKVPAKQAAAESGDARKSEVRATTGATPAKRASRASKAPISPDQALANTRALLEAKKRHDREGAAWQHLDGAASPAAGRYQSPEARSKAEELHAGESRMTAIEGSISTRDRKNQAKRDKR